MTQVPMIRVQQPQEISAVTNHFHALNTLIQHHHTHHSTADELHSAIKGYASKHGLEHEHEYHEPSDMDHYNNVQKSNHHLMDHRNGVGHSIDLHQSGNELNSHGTSHSVRDGNGIQHYHKKDFKEGVHSSAEQAGLLRNIHHTLFPHKYSRAPGSSDVSSSIKTSKHSKAILHHLTPLLRHASAKGYHGPIFTEDGLHPKFMKHLTRRRGTEALRHRAEVLHRIHKALPEGHKFVSHATNSVKKFQEEHKDH